VVGTALGVTYGNWQSPVAGVICGFTTMVLLVRFSARRLQTLEAEGLRERVMEIAGRAGVRVNGVRVFRNPASNDPNAFAHQRRRQILVTAGLLENLTRREVDAIMAHEVAHIRGTPSTLIPKLYWVYAPVYIPCWFVFGGSTLQFHWLEPFLWLPALAGVLVMASASRNRERRADLLSAQINGDPHGLIAGIARAQKLRKEPVAWGPVQGALATHPPLGERALFLARHFGFSEQLALAIVDDPDVIRGASPAEGDRYALRAKAPEK
jgi:heat shock protein HtpX